MNKTLAYFASGTGVKPEYKEIEIDKIFLIDKSFGENRILDKKIETIPMDAFDAIFYLYENNVRLDYFVCINEGLIEGGGSYPLNSDVFMGIVMKILKNEYYHIMCPDYYKNMKHSVDNLNYKEIYKQPLNLPYSKIEILEGEHGYIDPRIFSREYRGRVFKMSKIKNNIKEINLENGKTIRLIHDSIWCYNNMDKIYISIRDHKFLDNKLKNIAKIKQRSSIRGILSRAISVHH